jgi:uncharacterized membrane protein (DUF373 family)
MKQTDKRNVMFNLVSLKQAWSRLTTYERFEQIVSRCVMLLISLVIVYSLILVAVTLFSQITLNETFPDTTALKDVFGSLLTILILVEFNHSIASALKERSGVVQTRYVVLIAILVIARKVILLDFSTASFQTLVGTAVIALGFGLLYWLLGGRSPDASRGRSDAGE